MTSARKKTLATPAVHSARFIIRSTNYGLFLHAFTIVNYRHQVVGADYEDRAALARLPLLFGGAAAHVPARQGRDARRRVFLVALHEHLLRAAPCEETPYYPIVAV